MKGEIVGARRGKNGDHVARRRAAVRRPVAEAASGVAVGRQCTMCGHTRPLALALAPALALALALALTQRQCGIAAQR